MDAQEIEHILNEVKNNKTNFEINSKLFGIFEGNLSGPLDEWLRAQLSESSFRYASSRKSPINILKKIVDKLSTIYQQSPRRFVMEGTEQDDALLAYYEDSYQIDRKMNLANELFNMCRSTLVMPYLHKGKPRLRAVPNDRFFVYSSDEVDPTNPTHVLTCHGSYKDEKGGMDRIWAIWTDEEFKIVKGDGTILRDRMAALGNPEGINPYGKIPAVYVNRSSNLLIPPADIDALQLTLLIPGLLTDLNFASMFSLFSIIYGIDINDENVKMAPNAFWQFYSDPDTQKKPEIGTIKPEADVSDTLELIKSQLAFWLQSRNIKPGTVGDVEGSSFASAVSKMVDEADTSDERKKQVEYFTQAEDQLWDLTINHLHPYWVKTGQIEVRALFKPGVSVNTEFNEQIPLFNRGDLVRNLVAELEAGLTTKRRVLKTLNPRMSESEIDQLESEIAEDSQITVGGLDFGQATEVQI